MDSKRKALSDWTPVLFRKMRRNVLLSSDKVKGGHTKYKYGVGTHTRLPGKVWWLFTLVVSACESSQLITARDIISIADWVGSPLQTNPTSHCSELRNNIAKMVMLRLTAEQYQKLPIVADASTCSGKTYVITGGNSGLGLETARHLVEFSASRVILAVRNLKAGETAREDIEKTTGRKGVVEVWAPYEPQEELGADVPAGVAH